MPDPIDIDHLRSLYENLVDHAVRQPSTSYIVLASNGESVKVAIGSTTRLSRATQPEDVPAFGVVVEPNLPSDVQVWGRRFAGPALPAWSGLLAAIESVSEESVFIRSHLL